MLRSLKYCTEKESDLIGQLKQIKWQLDNAKYEVERLEKELELNEIYLKDSREEMKRIFLNILSESVIVEGKEI